MSRGMLRTIETTSRGRKLPPTRDDAQKRGLRGFFSRSNAWKTGGVLKIYIAVRRLEPAKPHIPRLTR